jgi:predicted naringenin-chalcone synthase
MGQSTMPATIAGLATALPAHRIHQPDAAEIAHAFSCETKEQDRVFAAIFRLSGVETRHSAVLDASDGDLASRQSFYGAASPTTRERMWAYEEHAGPLAARAAGGALADAAIGPGTVTHVITVSCSGFAAPGIDQALIRRLRLSPSVARTHVGFMGCHGLLNGLRVARAFVESDPSACVLLCAAELCSLHFQYGWDAERMVANALFADGAAAMAVVAGVERNAPPAYAILGMGSTLLPDCDDAMSWRVGDHGFTMTLSPRVPELIGQHIRPWLADWLARHGQTIESVGSWAVHPGGPRILSVFGEATGLDPSRLSPSFRVLADYGNMSSPTIAFILDRLRAASAPGPCVAIAFGPGLAVEAALLG